jgi:hypothetical protein
VDFEPATIKVEQVREFEELKGAIERALQPGQAVKVLKKMQGKGIRVRDFDSVLAQRLLDEPAAECERRAQALYASLTLSDQAQMREFYLSRIEEVEPALRARFKKLYQYY